MLLLATRADFFSWMLIVFQKAAFQDANVCLFVFDCIYFNDVSLMDRYVSGTA